MQQREYSNDLYPFPVNDATPTIPAKLIIAKTEVMNAFQVHSICTDSFNHFRFSTADNQPSVCEFSSNLFI